MKNNTTTDGSSILLAAIILFANLDVSDLTDYAIRVFIGCSLWFLFKLGADYFSEWFK